MVTNKEHIKKRDYYALLLLGLIPAIIGLIETMSIAKYFLWLGVSISILLIYLNIQNCKIREDHLTGLYNRRQLDIYLNNSIKELDKSEVLFMMMIDIDDFKEINDTYGHIEGDKALKYTADLFISTLQPDDFIARYAGDEFVIIIKSDSNSKFCKKKTINRLQRKFDEFNTSNITPYDINLSFGYDVYEPKLEMNTEEFITHIDRLMYDNKFTYEDREIVS